MVSSSLLAFSKQEVAEVSVEVAGAVGIEGKSGILSVVEPFVVDARDWREDFFVGPFSTNGLSVVVETFGRLLVCIAATHTHPLHCFDMTIGNDLVYQ